MFKKPDFLGAGAQQPAKRRGRPELTDE